MVVKDYYNGSCHIKINDEFCQNVTKEQIDLIAEKIGHIYREAKLKQVNKHRNQSPLL